MKPAHPMLPPRRPGRPAPEALLALRGMRAGMASPFAPVEGVTAEAVRLGGIDCIAVTPPQAQGPAIYFHSGGYRRGGPEASVPFVAHLVEAMGARVIVARYGLAPEAPFPAAVHDAWAVYEAMADERPLLVGASAGGGLALSLALLACAAGRPPRGLVLMSPWVDLTLTAETFRTKAQADLLFSLTAAQECVQLYLQGDDAAHPLASPLFGDLSGLPPTQILVGGAEVLLGDSLDLAIRLALAGVRVELIVERDTQHVWPALYPDLPQSRRAMQAMGRFGRELLS